MIEMKIPDDPLVLSAVADYLLRRSGADGIPEKGCGDSCTGHPGLHLVGEGPAPEGESPAPEGEGPAPEGEGPAPEGEGPSAAVAFSGEPAPPAPAAPAGVETDKRGFPWDERIHARTKAVLQDGTWRKKRGVEEALVESVEAEYRAAGFGAPSTAPAPAPVAEPPAPAPVIDFATLLLRITGDQVPQERVMEVLGAHGIAAIPVLGSRPDLVPTIFAELFPNG